MLSPSVSHILVFAVLTLLCSSAGALAQEGSEFGGTKAISPSLIGILYDLKQNQAREKMPMDNSKYGEVIDEFLSSGWDESVLNRYYRVTRPLYTTQIFIPLISASAAPKAFGVEKIVQPMKWLIHYKGQVSAPTSGTWRFWGYGEEVCSVAVNGRNVLLSNWKEITAPRVGWKSTEPPGQPAAQGALKAGDWFTLDKGEVIDLDVLIGERGGGVFCSFLLIEQKGVTYEKVDGHPLFPVFQLAPHDVPQPEAPKRGPRIASKAHVWSPVQ